MNITKKIIALLLLVSVAFSCEDYLDINDDPNAPANVALDLRIKPTILLTSGAAMWRGTREVVAVMQYMAHRQKGQAADCWKFTNQYFVWQNALVWTYPNAIDMIVMGEEQGSPHYSGAGKVIKVYLLMLLTDQLGSIPYDDLYDGKSKTVLEPKFEEQKDVYEKCIALLDEAVIDLSQEENLIGLNRRGGDILYEGDTEKWIKFAYALKARCLNHYTKKTSLYDPQAIIDACALAFDGDGQDAEFAYTSGGSQTQANPWSAGGFGEFGSYTTPRYGGWSEFFVNTLLSSPFAADGIDPRTPILMNPADSSGLFVGVPSGAGWDKGKKQGDYCRIVGGFYTLEDSPWPFITYSEVKLIEAEAKLRSSDIPGSREAFKEGVLSNMRKLGVHDTLITEATTRIDALTDADFTPLDSGLHYIMTEKYISLVMNPETWVDMRRMDYDSTIYHGLRQPANVNSIFAEGEWIRAMIYEYNEENRNPDNIPDNTAEVRLTTPVWWDVPE